MKSILLRILVLCTLSFSSSACLSGQQPTSDKANVEPESKEPDYKVLEAATESWRDRRLSFGKYVYTQSCASCHNEGVDGAPVIGDRREWSSRSPLWMAVLFEHAKSGFLGMPAKGGDTELTDQAVDAAAEYMLSVTFPEQPLD